jgi:hypothetical protein
MILGNTINQIGKQLIEDGLKLANFAYEEAAKHFINFYPAQNMTKVLMIT